MAIKRKARNIQVNIRFSVIWEPWELVLPVFLGVHIYQKHINPQCAGSAQPLEQFAGQLQDADSKASADIISYSYTNY